MATRFSHGSLEIKISLANYPSIVPEPSPLPAEPLEAQAVGARVAPRGAALVKAFSKNFFPRGPHTGVAHPEGGDTAGRSGWAILPGTSEADLRPGSYWASMLRCLLLPLSVAIAAIALPACSAPTSPSHVTGAYHFKLSDDVLYEAATTVLVTKRDVVVAVTCSASGERAIAAGVAMRLPAHVTLYTPPFSPSNPSAAPLVVTDDKYEGTLCTPDSYDVVKQ